jgi:hypothetical protein
MDKPTEIPHALSIRQPWIDLILRGEKTIEVREWRFNHRGPILLHASKTIDWKTVELFGYRNVLALPRGGLVALAEILEVFEFTRERWIELMSQHRVVHPPVREPVYGAVLGQIVPLSRMIPCNGARRLFAIPPLIKARTRREMINLGLMELSEY